MANSFHHYSHHAASLFGFSNRHLPNPNGFLFDWVNLRWVTSMHSIRPNSHRYAFSQSEESLILNAVEEEESLILNAVEEDEEESLILNAVEEEMVLSEETILKHMKTRHCVEEDKPNICVICQDQMFEQNLSIGTLRCGHEFHCCCVLKWLQRSKTCPLCKAVTL